MVSPDKTNEAVRVDQEAYGPGCALSSGQHGDTPVAGFENKSDPGQNV
jgi:hypothetical protein